MGAARIEYSVSAKKLAWTIISIGIVIAILGSAFFLLRSREEASLNGTWIARMQQPGQAAQTVRLRLDVTGNTVSGEVDSSPIREGSFDNGQLQFSTSNTKFDGKVRGREINLTAITADGITATGIARKTE
jgi:hypothetical protein